MNSSNVRFIMGIFACVLSTSALWGDFGTAFTYQGRLVKNGMTVSSGPPHCDFTFGLWDAAIAGNQKGNSPQVLNGVQVHDGLFTVSLDFGPAGIDGMARWLEITVQCPGDAMATTLTPRQELKPVPHALSVRGLNIQAGVSPNVVLGHAGNAIEPGAVGAVVGGGGGPFTEADGRCALNPTVLCDEDTDCGAEGPCVPDSTVGRCDDDSALCDADTLCDTGNCIAPISPNLATADFATVGGGYGNTAGGEPMFLGAMQMRLFPPGTGGYSTIGGGYSNTASGGISTIGGGNWNTASGTASTVGGGASNFALGQESTIGGGVANKAIGTYSTVPGGNSNHAGGDYSFAAGYEAMVRTAGGSGDADGDEGTFIWSDKEPDPLDDGTTPIFSTGANQFIIRATGGVRLATHDGSNPRIQAILPSTDTPDDLAIQPLGGNVGIGTATPTQKLDVAGTAKMTGFEMPTGAANGRVLTSNAAGVGTWTALPAPGDPTPDTIADDGVIVDSEAHNDISIDNGLLFALSGGSNAGIGTTTPANRLDVEGAAVIGATYSGTNAAPANGLLVEGFVGIGLAVPTTQLEVNGTATMTGFVLTTSPTPGHVLTSDAVGMGTWQPNAAGSNDWTTTGNAGTSPPTNFLGTTDSAAFEVKVDNARALRIEPNATSPNLIGGSANNSVTSGANGAFIGAGDTNSVTDNWGTVGGGMGNIAGDGLGTTSDKLFATVSGGHINSATNHAATVGGGEHCEASGHISTVSGGDNNKATGSYATVCGGAHNQATAENATVGGGEGNFATADNSAVGGGANNQAKALSATVPGGISNTAGGDYSFAAGRQAEVRDAATVGGGDTDGDEGTFVWADSTGGAFTSTGPNQFLIRAGGGVGIGRGNVAPLVNALEVEGDASKTMAGSWLANSDARIKRDVQTVTDALETLDKVRMVEFRYTDEYRAAHPTIMDRPYLNIIAQEFGEVFPSHVKSGGDTLPDGSKVLQADTYPLTIYSAAAVQELHRIVKEKDCEISELREQKDREIAELRKQMAELQTMVKALATRTGGGAP